jgi:hypothetical protein
MIAPVGGHCNGDRGTWRLFHLKLVGEPIQYIASVVILDGLVDATARRGLPRRATQEIADADL